MYVLAINVCNCNPINIVDIICIEKKLDSPHSHLVFLPKLLCNTKHFISILFLLLMINVKYDRVCIEKNTICIA